MAELSADRLMDALAENREERILLAHVEDLRNRADSGVLAHTAYLNPGEQTLCRRFLQRRGGTENDSFLFYGGFAYAERRLLFCLPEYLSADARGQESGGELSDWFLLQCEESAEIASVLVRGTGYRFLNHRDYLGALLSLGIERETVGDICCLDETQAVILSVRPIASFLCSTLERVGAERVSVSLMEPERRRALEDPHRYQALTGSVASNRLDCLVGELASLSREKAKQTILQGDVCVDYRTETKPDVFLPDGAVISIRGVGRFRFDGVTGTSRRGKLQIRATKWI